MSRYSPTVWLANLLSSALILLVLAPVLLPQSVAIARPSFLGSLRAVTGFSNQYYQYVQYVQDVYSVMHAFTATTTFYATNPAGPLIQASDGNFYGTTVSRQYSPSMFAGFLFRMDASGRAITLHSFGATTTDGADPSSGVIQAKDGYLYGATSFGGLFGDGTIYRIGLDGTNYEIVYDFAGADGRNPIGPLTQAADGSLYGTTFSGGVSNNGILFRFDPAGGFAALHFFGDGSVANDGYAPSGGVTVAKDGYLYGTCEYGGQGLPGYGGAGVIYRSDTSGQITILHSFVGPHTGDGSVPSSPPIEANDGFFYGVAQGGVVDAKTHWFGGVLYRFSASGSYEILRRFSDGTVPDDGVSPTGPLLQANDGHLYGATSLGGVRDLGVVYRVDLAGNEEVLHEFEPTNQTYSYGSSSLIQGLDGALYGMQSAGYGLAYRLDLFANLIFQNSASHQVAIWDLNEQDRLLSGSLVNVVPPAGWTVAGSGDFNGDGPPDLLFQNATTGGLVVWYMHGSTRVGSTTLTKTLPPGSTIVSVADFNGDGWPDLLLQNATTRQLTIWYFHGASYVGSAVVPTLPGAGWKPVGAADFNGDGHPDILFQNSTSGQLYLFYMNGATVKSGGLVDGVVPAGWKVGALSTISGHAEPDIVFQNGSHLMAWTLNAGKLQTSTQINQPVASGWALVGP